MKTAAATQPSNVFPFKRAAPPRPFAPVIPALERLSVDFCRLAQNSMERWAALADFYSQLGRLMMGLPPRENTKLPT